MSVERVIANHLRIARDDLDGARTLLSSGNRNAIYLCEQAAEKIIRAVMTSENLHGLRHHQLDQFVGAIPDLNPLKPALRMLEPLTDYATTYRYVVGSTGRIPETPPAHLVQSHIDRVQQVLNQAAKAYGVDLDTTEPAKSPNPFR